MERDAAFIFYELSEIDRVDNIDDYKPDHPAHPRHGFWSWTTQEQYLAKGEIVKDVVKKSPVNVSEQRVKREQYESSAESDGRNQFPKLSASIALEFHYQMQRLSSSQ